MLTQSTPWSEIVKKYVENNPKSEIDKNFEKYKEDMRKYDEARNNNFPKRSKNFLQAKAKAAENQEN